MTIKNEDFLKLLKILNKYFNSYINKEDKKQSMYLENVELRQENSTSIKHIFVPYNSVGDSYELWINENPHFDTEYVFFYKNEYNNKIPYFFKDYRNLEEEILNSSIINCYNILSKLKAMKIEQF